MKEIKIIEFPQSSGSKQLDKNIEPGVYKFPNWIKTNGFFFLDGHTDFLWPEFSGTGGTAGLDLGIVTGFGLDKLTNINRQ